MAKRHRSHTPCRHASTCGDGKRPREDECENRGDAEEVNCEEAEEEEEVTKDTFTHVQTEHEVTILAFGTISNLRGGEEGSGSD